MRTNVATQQQTADSGFAAASQWTLSGTGIGTSAVTGGVLQITSTTNVYYALPATADTPLYPGIYTVTFTILNFTSGAISWIASTSSALSAAAMPPSPRTCRSPPAAISASAVLGPPWSTTCRSTT